MLRRFRPFRMLLPFAVRVRCVRLSRRAMNVLVVGGPFRRLAPFRCRRSCRCTPWVVRLRTRFIAFCLVCRLIRFARWRLVLPSMLLRGWLKVFVVVRLLVLRLPLLRIVVRRVLRRRNAFRVPCRCSLLDPVRVVVRVTRRSRRRRLRWVIVRVVRLLLKYLVVRLLFRLTLARRCRLLMVPLVTLRLRKPILRRAADHGKTL